LNPSRGQRICAAVVTALLLLATQRAYGAAVYDERAEIAALAGAYVRALYARDFRAAYTYISSQDQRLKDVHSYSRDRGAYSGFTQGAARAEWDDVDDQ
jgi:hypothetical protein